MSSQLTHQNGFFLSIYSGEAKAEVFGELLDALFVHPEWKKGTPVIHDQTKLTATHFTSDDIATIVRSCASRNAQFGEGKFAIIAPSDLVYGFSRMWSSMLEENWTAPTRVFRSFEEAQTWLLET